MKRYARKVRSWTRDRLHQEFGTNPNLERQALDYLEENKWKPLNSQVLDRTILHFIHLAELLLIIKKSYIKNPFGQIVDGTTYYRLCRDMHSSQGGAKSHLSRQAIAKLLAELKELQLIRENREKTGRRELFIVSAVDFSEVIAYWLRTGLVEKRGNGFVTAWPKNSPEDPEQRDKIHAYHMTFHETCLVLQHFRELEEAEKLLCTRSHIP
jgi:hypothetical protein